MKTIKLILQKEGIVSLNDVQMNAMYGGEKSRLSRQSDKSDCRMLCQRTSHNMCVK